MKPRSLRPTKLVSIRQPRTYLFLHFFYLVMFGISRPDSYICHGWSYPDCRKNKDSTTRPSLLFSRPLFLCKTVGNDTWYGDYFIPKKVVFFFPPILLVPSIHWQCLKEKVERVRDFPNSANWLRIQKTCHPIRRASLNVTSDSAVCYE